jgi:hypothetical protein
MRFEGFLDKFEDTIRFAIPMIITSAIIYGMFSCVDSIRNPTHKGYYDVEIEGKKDKCRGHRNYTEVHEFFSCTSGSTHVISNKSFKYKGVRVPTKEYNKIFEGVR